MAKKKKPRGINDPILFKTINNIMTTEHKQLLGKHLITIGYKLTKDKEGKTIDDVITEMKNVFIQLKKLKQQYER